MTPDLRVDCPVRILQGMQDSDVPYTHALKLVDCLAHDDVTLTLVKDGDHRLSARIRFTFTSSHDVEYVILVLSVFDLYHLHFYQRLTISSKDGLIDLGVFSFNPPCMIFSDALKITSALQFS